MTQVAAEGQGGGQEYTHFFQVRLDLFDGPIDLLLHLVKQNELPIEKLSLAQVAQQYLECIEAAHAFDLEVAGEYLVIAATLVSIKSSIILNEPVELVEDEDGMMVDPHEELLRRLREAEIYKKSAVQLGGRELLHVDVFEPSSLLKDFEPPPVKYKQHDPMLLGRAFKKLLDQAGEALGPYTISVDSVSIVERMMTILDTLKKAAAPVVFHALIPDRTSRGSIIGSFVALLELCKRQVIHVRQDESFQEIFIALAETEIDLSTLSSEFDGTAAAESDAANEA